MISPINSLSNIEYMLYGNTPNYGNMSVPSMMNNYCAMSPSFYGNQYTNPYYYGGYNNSAFGQNIPSTISNPEATMQNDGVFTGLSKKERDAIINDYAKSLSPSESILGAGVGGAAFGVLFHPRAIAHPINTVKSFKQTKGMFADITKKGTNLATMWAKPEGNEVLRDAYTAMNRIDARSLKGKGLHIWRKPLESGEYEHLKGIMEKALKSNSPAEIIKATETLNQANVKNGALPQAWNWIKNLFRAEKSKIPSALENSNNTDAIKKAVLTAEKAGKGTTKTYLQTLKTSGGGIAGGLFMLGMDYLMDMGKIKDCFNKDSKTGWTQLGQTTVKGLGSAIGWAAGEALGTWGCAKLLATVGTAISPGLGTVIGAFAGIAIGSIGCAIAGRITKKLVGQDVGDKVQAEKLAATQDGQIQLLKNTAERMQKGEKVDPQAQQAILKIVATENLT